MKSVPLEGISKARRSWALFWIQLDRVESRMRVGRESVAVDIDSANGVEGDVDVPQRYVLVTPARDEEVHIGRLIASVTSQTVAPTRWVIVNDSSVDATGQLAAEAAETWSFIRVVQSPNCDRRDFASKVWAFEAGVDELGHVAFELVGNLDADIELPNDYFERLQEEFARDPELGIAGGRVIDVDDVGQRVSRPRRRQMVPGAVQLFRRECFRDIGGYLPLRYGNEDTVAVIKAQMSGWSVRTIDTLEVLHHRLTGTAGGSLLTTRFAEGRSEYFVGYHPLFALAKALRWLPQRPIGIGAVCRLAGYMTGLLGAADPEVDHDVMSFLRRRQLRELGLRR